MFLAIKQFPGKQPTFDTIFLDNVKLDVSIICMNNEHLNVDLSRRPPIFCARRLKFTL